MNIFSHHYCKHQDHFFWMIVNGNCFHCEKVHAKHFPEFKNVRKVVSKVEAEMPYQSMENSEYYLSVIDEMKKSAGEVEALWNGHNAGKTEERAMCARDIRQKCNEIIELINELNS